MNVPLTHIIVGEFLFFDGSHKELFLNFLCNHFGPHSKRGAQNATARFPERGLKPPFERFHWDFPEHIIYFTSEEQRCKRITGYLRVVFPTVWLSINFGFFDWVKLIEADSN